MLGWHHRLNGHEFGQTPGDSSGQRSLVCCSPWGHKELAFCVKRPKYWRFNFNISPSNEYLGLISFRIVVLKKILASPLDCKEFQQVHPKGNQS